MLISFVMKNSFFNHCCCFWIFSHSCCCLQHKYLQMEEMKLYHGEKYLVTESMINSFTWQMNLTVKNLHKNDFAPYICSSENALGKSDARIRLQGMLWDLVWHKQKKWEIKWKDRKINFYSTLTSHSLIYGTWNFPFVLNAKTFFSPPPPPDFLLHLYKCRTPFTTEANNNSDTIHSYNSQTTDK